MVAKLGWGGGEGMCAVTNVGIVWTIVDTAFGSEHIRLAVFVTAVILKGYNLFGDLRHDNHS